MDGVVSGARADSCWDFKGDGAPDGAPSPLVQWFGIEHEHLLFKNRQK